ncbi:RNA polymerase sigma factor [Verrucomicrobiota bacterium]
MTAKRKASIKKTSRPARKCTEKTECLPQDDPLYTRQTLLQKIKDRYDEVAWEDFISYYRQYVYNISRGMGLDHHNAEELVQMVMLKLWKKLPEIKFNRERGKFRSWLCTVVRNTVKNFMRSYSRRASRLKRYKKNELPDYLRRIDLNSLEMIAEEEWKEYISNLAWGKIKDDFSESVQEAFLLWVKGRPVSEIAKTLKLRENTIYVYKSRVQNKLQKMIRHLENELD